VRESLCDKSDRRSAGPALRAWGLLAVLALAGLARGDATPEQHPRVVPFQVIDGAILVQVQVGNTGSQAFLFDTGVADSVVLDISWAKEHGYADGSEPRIGEGNPVIALGQKQVDDVGVGWIHRVGVYPLLLDMRFLRQTLGTNVVGIIGQGFFEPMPYPLTLDYMSQELTITGQWERDAFLQQMKDAGAVTVPFQLSEDLMICVKGRIGSAREGTYHLDTGANGCLVKEGTLKAIGDEARKWPRLEGGKAQDIYGLRDVTLVRIPQFSVGSATITNEVFAVMTSGGLDRGLLEPAKKTPRRDEAVGLLGYDFLKHFITTIDYYGKKLLFLEHPGYKDTDPNEYTSIGVAFIEEEWKIKVGAVARPSPAYEAGIREGDELVSLDGTPVEKLSLKILRETSHGEAGTKVAIVLRRDGKQVEYTLTQKKLL
jgi:hypothetical protein